MNRTSIIMASFCAAAALWAVPVLPAAAQQASAPAAKGDKPMRHGMMDHDSMMGMMQSCQSMMGSGLPSLPKMPPGNEKLELQMRAEMMQKLGEIAAKYADRVKESR